MPHAPTRDLFYRWHPLAVLGLKGRILDAHPQWGFYAVFVISEWLPVAITRRGGDAPPLFAEVGPENRGVVIEGALLPRLWRRAAQGPITEHQYWELVDRLPTEWRHFAECLLDDLAAELETLDTLAELRAAR